MRRIAAGLAVVLAGTLLTAGPALAEDEEPYDYVAARTWAAWLVVDGTPSVARAAADALLGSDADILAFEQGGGADEAFAADNRAAAEALAGSDGPTTKAAALTALAGPPEAVETFVNGGFQAPWTSDERLRVYRVLAAGGPTTQTAAQTALDGTADDITEFLSTGQEKAEYADDRVAATRMLTGGVNNSGPVLNTAAAAALGGTPVDLRDFVVRGQFVARARDKELASITSLTQQAKEAGETTSREALAASDASTRAMNAAEAAKKAAQTAAAETKAAGGSAKKASAAAGRAADAAEGAAKAAKAAKGAANAAMRAAAVAEDAARQATSAASLTAQAAARAQNAAAAARTDASKASAARQAAQAARDAAARAVELEKVRAERDRALAQAKEAANASKSASGHAGDAANAADEAGSQAGVSAEQAQRARNAAATARRQAAAAARAADRALAFANAAAKASDEAFQFAADAAAHATAAAAAADDAADHAGDASKAAAESTKHAQAAVAAADLASQAAAQAVTLEKLARDEDAVRLAEATEQGVEDGQDALDLERAQAAAGGELVAWNRDLLWDTEEEDRVNPATRALLNEATAGATDAVVHDRGRRAALTLVKTGGEWTREAAEDALAGTDAELGAWLNGGRQAAVGQDNRARLWSVIDKLADGAEKTAAQTAVNGDDAAVQAFLRTRNYAGKVAKDRTAIYQILTTAGPNLKTAGEKALAGTAADLHQFLRTGQYPARTADDRLEVYRVMDAGGAEVKAAAQVALAGPASSISYFLSTSQYQAVQRDNEQASHVAAVQKLIAEAQQYAETAHSDANEALRVAALARNASAEATTYANQAKASRDKAAVFAQQAADSATAAKNSADQAAQSATVARNAANAAQASANKAAQSASVATAAASRAKSDAAGARQAAAEAKASAAAAGKDAAAAQAAADEAVQIYTDKLAAYEKERRSQEAGSGSDGTGTANAEHRTWSCLDPTQMSAECLKVYLSFANALIRPGQCGTTANRDSTGCEMLGDIKEFVDENPDLLLDTLQFVLMACGLVPGAGEACDVIDGGVSLARGDYLGAALSGFAAIPFIGAGATFLKGIKMSDKMREAMKIFKKLEDKCDLARNSFAPGTPVLLAGGRRRPIEQVRVGDRVLATDPGTGRTTAKAVTATISGVRSKQRVDITVDTDGDAGSATATISATAYHPFWAPQLRAWISATALAAGMTVQNAGGEPIAIERVKRRIETGKVYNLTVDDFHTYYVGAGRQSVLVHNCGKLDLDNDVAGAHPKEHVGRSDPDLERDAAKKKNKVASSLNSSSAQATIDAALAQNGVAKKIKDFVESGKKPRGALLELPIYDAKTVIGRVADVSSGTTRYSDGTKLKLVIKKIKNKTDGHDGNWVLYTMEVS